MTERPWKMQCPERKIPSALASLLRIMALSFLLLIPVYAASALPTSGQQLAAVARHRFTLAMPWFGRVEAVSVITMTARVNGRITKIYPRDESEVHQGDMLFEFGGKEVAARRANLNEQVKLADKAVQAARRNLAIQKNMLGEHLSNRKLLNTTARTLARTESRLSAAKQALATFAAASRIRAPVEGYFTERAVYEGQYVTVGTLLARIVNPKRVRIRASLFPPQDLQLTGRTAIVHVSSKKALTGTVASRMPDATREGGVQVWIEGNGLQSLAPGVQVSGDIPLARQALAVPAGAIARDDLGRGYVFIKTDHGFRKQRVVTGLHDRDRVEIVSGLRGDERVATGNAYELLYRSFSKAYRAPD
ncbi:MAG: efflux RND transporter periplasmic adaptor subunit [Mariprofundaceae bacterium]|nr:efflux RND transporter periplasmic adaptor subunit [Mariprofundaceae bacterium]